MWLINSCIKNAINTSTRSPDCVNVAPMRPNYALSIYGSSLASSLMKVVLHRKHVM